MAEETDGTQTFELSRTNEVQELPVVRAPVVRCCPLSPFYYYVLTPILLRLCSLTCAMWMMLQRRARFNAVRRLTLFFPDNFGDGDEDVTRISYIGFKGEWMQLGRAPANILYEAAANPGDHKIKGTSVNQMGSGIGGRGPGI